uniref:Putative secreted peptide n=1 Tax=Anopheles braziliensis TaxID=58242 RepID=A0A2M3ZU93_9DIPT
MCSFLAALSAVSRSSRIAAVCRFHSSFRCSASCHSASSSSGVCSTIPARLTSFEASTSSRRKCRTAFIWVR